MNHYYKTLGLPISATKTEIKKAYRKLAMQYHPDRNPNPDAQRKFIEVDQAYNYLIDTRTRRIYQSKQNYTPPKTQKPEPKQAHKMNEDEFHRAFKKAKLTKEYLAQKKTLEANYGCLHGLVSMVSIMVLPIVAGIIAYELTNSGLFTIISLISVPALGMYVLNKIIYNASEPQKKKLYQTYKKELSEL